MDQRTSNEKSYKIDLYSIPVFLVELAVLSGLAYAAFVLHFQFKPEPFVTGFYCDDTAYRQYYDPTRWTKKFDRQLDMLTIISMLAVAPILMVSRPFICSNGDGQTAGSVRLTTQHLDHFL